MPCLAAFTPNVAQKAKVAIRLRQSGRICLNAFDEEGDDMQIRRIGACGRGYFAILMVLAVRPANGIEPAAVWEVWMHRQRAVPALSVSWKTDIWIGGVSATESLASETYTVEEGLVFDRQGRVRADVYSVGREGRGSDHVISQRVISIFDGTKETEFFERTSGNFPAAFIRPGTTISVTGFRPLIPLFLAIRPLDPSFHNVPLKEIADSGSRADFQGRRCAVYHCGTDDVWVTDDEDALLVRLYRKSSRDGRVRSEMQITYTHDQPIWMIQEWTILGYGVDQTQIAETRTSRVIDYTIDPSESANTFALTYPPGTWVSNRITNERHITREGRPDRPVLKGEFTGANYEQLRDSEPPPALDDPTRTANWWLWGNCVFLITAIIGFCAMRIRSMKQKVVGLDSSRS